MRIISYRTKTTDSNNTYYAVSQIDKDWILAQCRKIMDFVHAGEDYDDDEIQELVKTLKKSNRTLPWKSKQHGSGANSIYSMCAGTVDNFTQGTQYDFSEKTATGLTRAFALAEDLGLVVESIDFREISTHTEKTTGTTNTFLDLFDVDIKITVRKKQ